MKGQPDICQKMDKQQNRCIYDDNQLWIGNDNRDDYIRLQIDESQEHGFQYEWVDRLDGERVEGLSVMRFDVIYGIVRVNQSIYIIFVTKSTKVAEIFNHSIYHAQKFTIITLKKEYHANIEQHLQQSLELANFYYSTTYDLSSTLQYQMINTEKYRYRQDFYVNQMHKPIQSGHPSFLKVVFICGFVQMSQMMVQGELIRQVLVSRGNCQGLGRRWLRRGVDEQGNAANHYETQLIIEQIGEKRHLMYSHVQVRGSIPFLWKQQPSFTPFARLTIHQNHALNAQVMSKHIQQLTNKYRNVIMINLISKTGHQSILGQQFDRYFNEIDEKEVRLIWHDYTKEYSAKKEQSFVDLLKSIQKEIHSYGFFKIQRTVTSPYDKWVVLSRQSGIVRTNCIDCIDRTNYIQTIICKIICLYIQGDRKQQKGLFSDPYQMFDDFRLEASLKTLWKKNGRSISHQYCGTGTMKEDFQDSGKRTFLGVIKDFCVGSKRFYLGHFKDYYYQNCLDLLFNKIDHQNDMKNFNGNWSTTLSLWLSLSSIAIPFAIAYKVHEVCQSKSQKIGYTCATIIIGWIAWSKMMTLMYKTIFQKPISRKYQQRIR